MLLFVSQVEDRGSEQSPDHDSAVLVLVESEFCSLGNEKLENFHLAISIMWMSKWSRKRTRARLSLVNLLRLMEWEKVARSQGGSAWKTLGLNWPVSLMWEHMCLFSHSFPKVPLRGLFPKAVLILWFSVALKGYSSHLMVFPLPFSSLCFLTRGLSWVLIEIFQKSNLNRWSL